MSDTIERTRLVAFRFTAAFLKIATPAIAYKGKVESTEIDGNYFTTRSNSGEIQTIVVDRKCNHLWLFEYEATAEDISEVRNRKGAWEHHKGVFNEDVVLSQNSIDAF